MNRATFGGTLRLGSAGLAVAMAPATLLLLVVFGVSSTQDFHHLMHFLMQVVTGVTL